ncbi:MAG: hypothetical protein ACREIT_09475, partial [Tepidisphaeraceae bacterium]
KVTLEPDYYMEIAGIIATQGDDGSANEDDGTPDNNTDFNRLVEQYRHGLKRGSNYLYADWHVGTVMPNEALKALDPWDVGS